MGNQSVRKDKIIVVLGAGRTGTSLLTNILNRLGMSISKSEIPLSEQNPVGFFEDADIVAAHKEILSILRCHAYFPLPEDFIKNQGINSYVFKLKNIVLDNINKTSSLWGFKDPRTPSLLPLWMRVFNSGKITPIYILSVRNPKSMVASMHKQYSASPQIAELTWLHRTCEALYQTGGNCFIVHYEDWFTEKASEVGKQLLQYTGLDKFWNKASNVSDTVAGVVKPNLNRAVYNDYEVKNHYVLKLYNVLLQCHGDQFDRQALRDVVMECRKGMSEFSGWAMEAQCFFKQSYKNKTKAVFETNKYLMKCKDLTDENKRLKIHITVKQKECEVLQRKNFNIETTTSFRVGQIFVNAVAKPGKNTLLFPFYLLRTFLSSRVVSK